MDKRDERTFIMEMGYRACLGYRVESDICVWTLLSAGQEMVKESRLSERLGRRKILGFASV